MGQYANVTSRRMYQFLKWLGNHKEVDVIAGGAHPIKITCHSNGESYPIPISHRFVNKHIVRDFIEWLVKNNICSKDEFDRHI